MALSHQRSNNSINIFTLPIKQYRHSIKKEFFFIKHCQMFKTSENRWSMNRKKVFFWRFNETLRKRLRNKFIKKDRQLIDQEKQIIVFLPIRNRSRVSIMIKKKKKKKKRNYFALVIGWKGRKEKKKRSKRYSHETTMTKQTKIYSIFDHLYE